MSLKNKVLNYLDTNKSAQGSLVAVVAASVILSVIVASATQWYLAFNKNLNVSGDSLTGMSIAKDIWDKMTTQDFEDMKGKAGTTETSTVGGYTVTREYGNAGVFDESTGECKVGSSTPTAANPRACMDVTIKVTDKDGKQVFTATPTRVSQNLGNYYVKNDNFPKEFRVAMEDEDESVEMPEGKALYAYVDGQKVPLSSQGGGNGSPPDTSKIWGWQTAEQKGYIKSTYIWDHQTSYIMEVVKPIYQIVNIEIPTDSYTYAIPTFFFFKKGDLIYWRDMHGKGINSQTMTYVWNGSRDVSVPPFHVVQEWSSFCPPVE